MSLFMSRFVNDTNVTPSSHSEGVMRHGAVVTVWDECGVDAEYKEICMRASRSSPCSMTVFE